MLQLQHCHRFALCHLMFQGRLVINPSTHLEIMDDKSNRKHRLFVTCGKSGKGYELYSDDDKTRNEWKVDIEKVFCMYMYLAIIIMST